MFIDRNESEEEMVMTKRLKILTFMTVGLAVGRIFAVEILMCISDLLTALMIYFYMYSKTKCMAICCMINGVIGIVYAFIKFFPAWTLAKAHWFSFYHSLLFLIALYAIVVYSLICYVSYVGIRKYEMGFGLPSSASQQENGYGVSTNYGAISTGSTTAKFTPFSGKGVTVS